MAELDDRQAQAVAKRIESLVTEAERVSREIDRKLVIAPVLLRTVQAKGTSGGNSVCYLRQLSGLDSSTGDRGII